MRPCDTSLERYQIEEHNGIGIQARKMTEDDIKCRKQTPTNLGGNWPYQLQEAISGATSNEIRHRRARWKDRRVKNMLG
jgi:hypothetical protein